MRATLLNHLICFIRMKFNVFMFYLNEIKTGQEIVLL